MVTSIFFYLRRDYLITYVKIVMCNFPYHYLCSTVLAQSNDLFFTYRLIGRIRKCLVGLMQFHGNP